MEVNTGAQALSEDVRERQKDKGLCSSPAALPKALSGERPQATAAQAAGGAGDLPWGKPTDPESCVLKVWQLSCSIMSTGLFFFFLVKG